MLSKESGIQCRFMAIILSQYYYMYAQTVQRAA